MLCAVFSFKDIAERYCCEFAHKNIIPGDELEWVDQECTDHIIPAKVVSIKENQYPFGWILIHFIYITMETVM